MGYLDNVGILGAGSWGTVLAILASGQINKIYLFDRDPVRVAEMRKSHENKRYLSGHSLPDNIHFTNSLEEVFKKCRLVLPVVPSYAMRDFCRDFSTFVHGDHLIVHGTKGFEPVTHKRMSKIIVEETGCLRVGALSGPNLAAELAKGLPGATVIASQFEEVIDAATSVFQSKQLKIVGSSDLAGVEWVGALKNILAISAGICFEMGLGQNATAMILTQGLDDIRRLMIAMGAKVDTLFGLAGFGDIIATSTSTLSRNFRAGQKLTKGQTTLDIESELAMTVEGFNTLQAAKELGEQKSLDLPLIQAIWQLAYGGQSIDIILKKII